MSEAIAAQKGPYEVDIVGGENYAWCSCGRSAKQPFCDGAHKATALKPKVFTGIKTQAVYLCGCKATGHPPYCDGTHCKM